MRTSVRMAGRTPPPRGPRVAQLQLELGAADRLAALIEESGEPLAPERAAGALLALPRVPGELARRVLEEVVLDDARLVRHEDGRVGLVGLAPPPVHAAGRGRLDGRRPRDHRRRRERAHRRDRSGAARGRRADRHALAPGRPRHSAAPAHQPAHGHPRSRPRGRGPAAPGAGRAARAGARQRVRRAQRLVRRRHARSGPHAPRRHAHRHARARHRRARPPPAGRPPCALRPRQRVGSLRRHGAAVSPRAARRARHGRGAARR